MRRVSRARGCRWWDPGAEPPPGSAEILWLGYQCGKEKLRGCRTRLPWGLGQAQQGQALGRWCGKVSLLLFGVALLGCHSIPVRPVTPMEIEAFKQGDSVSSCWHTVKGFSGWQIRHFYSWQQQYPSDGKPAPKSGMYAHTWYTLGRG